MLVGIGGALRRLNVTETHHRELKPPQAEHEDAGRSLGTDTLELEQLLLDFFV